MYIVASSCIANTSTDNIQKKIASRCHSGSNRFTFSPKQHSKENSKHVVAWAREELGLDLDNIQKKIASVRAVQSRTAGCQENNIQKKIASRRVGGFVRGAAETVVYNIQKKIARYLLQCQNIEQVASIQHSKENSKLFKFETIKCKV